METVAGVALSFCILGLIGRPVSVHGECLKTPIAMQTCVPDLNMGDAGGYELVSDFKNSRKLCREGDLQKAMSCLETVYNDCASESKHQKNPLDVMVDPGRWRNVIQSFCDNVDYLALHEDCQQKIVVESSSCIQERSAGFQNRTSEVLASALKDKNRNREKMLEDMLAVGCRFAEEVLDCLMKPLKGECPCRYQRIIQETVVGVMPPFCHMEASDDEDDFDCDYDDETSSDDGFSVDSDTSNNGDDVNNNNYNNYNDIYSSNGGHVVIDKDEDRETRYEDTYPKYRGPPRGLGVEGKYNVHDGSSQGGGENPSSRASFAASCLTVCFCLASLLR